uniref:Immunoglobulin domain-containing protein n=1 Tax=Rhinolophus ferrumequinum TaxID=59479 RepID=A0A671DZR4_RHIFE
MGLPLLLPLLLLLLLLASLQAGRSTKCNSQYLYEVNQPKQLSAPEGGSVQIPFSFCHPWELSNVLSVTISWKWKHFHGETIYNTTPSFIHKDFKNRLSLNWTEDGRSGFLQISNLRRQDKSVYFCRVHLTARNHSKKNWQCVPGTNLVITPATKKTTKGPPSTTTTATTTTATTTTAATTEGLCITDGIKSSDPCLGAIVGVALAGAVFIIAILGVLVYLRCKRNKGLWTNARAPARGSFQNTEENYENTRNKGQHREPELDPKDDNIFYASLALSSLTSRSAPPCQPPQQNPQDETLYSTLKT